MGVQTLPSICWVPFSILWFGLTQTAIVFVVVMGSAFSISIAVDNAINNVPPIYKKAALTMGANQKQIYWKVVFPAALPDQPILRINGLSASASACDQMYHYLSPSS